MNAKSKKLIHELCDFEKAVKRLSRSKVKIPVNVANFKINPALKILNLSHRTLLYLQKTGEFPKTKLKKNGQWVIIWLKNTGGGLNFKIASNSDLLALKILSQKDSFEKTCSKLKIPRHKLENNLRYVSKNGIIFAPKSKIRRTSKISAVFPHNKEKYLTANTFTLQWHITNACELHCKHCYDRSRRSLLTLKQGLVIIKQLSNFCSNKNVKGHICFTGGNPFLHKSFLEIYTEAAKNGFSTSILGNPVSRNKLKEIVSVQMPGYYQVSLEGLKKYNDRIRGRGHFAKTLDFLKVLKNMDISSAVMLTLNEYNINQVIPLAEKLKKFTAHFTFNRLSRTGEGKNMYLPSRSAYKKFLSDYITLSLKNRILGYKDNLLNAALARKGFGVFEGCTGHGCGATFNFVALLPDGEVHACRKFPSLIGNIFKKDLTSIYNSKKAQKYRRGSLECGRCQLRPVCGGCMAVSHSYGRNIFTQKDPHCFF
jgi:selenobiotic family peptide radical SAM maturase